MGTLTGNTASLPEHCPHKLPTSCRLTATPSCCACQDKRPHAAAYPMYVDGIGMTMRSTRWTRYCYFCREFWENRVRATEPPMPASETRVPDVPDQAEFLKRWFDFHRGYRVETVLAGAGEDTIMTEEVHVGQANGDSTQEVAAERRIPLTLELPWRDTAPGRLPLKEDNQDSLVPTTWQRPRLEGEGEVPQVSIEETLDDMLEAADQEQSNRSSFLRNSSATSPGNDGADYQSDSQAQARAQPQQTPVEARRTTLMQTQLPTTAQATSVELRALRDQISTLTNQRQGMIRNRDRTNRELEAIEVSLSDLRQRADTLTRNARAMANMNRVFGSREEIEQQGADYVSPLTSMFTRAYERFRVAEEVRAEERASMQNLERNRVLLQSAWSQRRFPFESARRARNEASAHQQQSQPHIRDGSQANNAADRQRSEQELIQSIDPGLRRLLFSHRAGTDTRSLPESLPSLDDANVERPPPKTDDEMTFKLICKICLQQTSDTAVLPCGHLVMCSFCADAWVPTRRGTGVDDTMAIGRVNCPLCRRQVKRKVRIYTA